MVDEGPARRPRLLVGLLCVLLIVVVATSAILLHDRRNAAGIETKRPADIGNDGWADDSAGRAVVAARRATATYFTLDYRDLRNDMDAVRALGTSDFVERYDAGAASLAKRLTRGRLVLSAELPRDGTATEYLVTDRAQVLVSVDVTRSSDGARGAVTSNRIRVELVLVDGDWRVAALDEVA